MRQNLPDGRAALVLCGAVVAISTGLIGQAHRSEGLIFWETLMVAPATAARQIPPRETLPVTISPGRYTPDYARRTLVPAMGGAIIVGGVDSGAGAAIYVVNPGAKNSLLRSTFTGRFHDETETAGVAGSGGSLSAAFSDFLRTGHQSLFVVGVNGVTLYRNNGDDTFTDATAESGLRARPGDLYTSAVLGDIDGDGLQDLLVSIYTNLNEPPSKSTMIFPFDFGGAISRLYRNNGDGTFTDMTRAAGMTANPGRARKGLLTDFNGDSKLDILLLRDDKPPVLYLNRGGWKFEDKTWVAGDQLTRHAFFDGAIVDLNSDGRPDVVLWSSQGVDYALNQGNATFVKAVTIPSRFPAPGLFGFQATLADLDGNGGSADLLFTDSANRLHAFVSTKGTLRELPIQLPASFQLGYLVPFRSRSAPGVRCIAMHPDGHIALIGLR